MNERKELVLPLGSQSESSGGVKPTTARLQPEPIARRLGEEKRMVPCVQDQAGDEELPPRLWGRVVREVRRPGQSLATGLRLHVTVPEEVRIGLEEADLVLVDEINRVVDALWVKFLHEPSPAPTATHSLEVMRFRRLSEADKLAEEALTRAERMFVILNAAHKSVSKLIKDPALASELVTEITLRLAESVCLAQKAVRREWGTVGHDTAEVGL